MLFRIFIFIHIFLAILILPQHGVADRKSADPCQRIISLAPSITETLFALGLGSKVVAVTRFCAFPPQAASLPALGGLFDTNLEEALMLSPDLVVGLPESSTVMEKFAALGLRTLQVSNRSVQQIIDSFSRICRLCDCLEVSSTLAADMQAEIDMLAGRRKDSSARSVALIVASSLRSGSEELYLSGKDGFYSSIFEALNARNVMSDTTIAMPSASFESLAALRPDIIFIVEAEAGKFDNLKSRILRYLPAVKIVALNADYASVPGPRFLKLMQDISRELDL